MDSGKNEGFLTSVLYSVSSRTKALKMESMYGEEWTDCRKFLVKLAIARAETLTRPNPPSVMLLKRSTSGGFLSSSWVTQLRMADWIFFTSVHLR